MAGVPQRIHHLNCATMRPAGGRLPMFPDLMVAHCLLVEGETGLTLVDTGLGTGDVADPGRLGRPFVTAVGAALEPSETATARIAALGLDPADVRDIVLTHLDLDHAGGIGDFPAARVHVASAELAAARARRSPKEKGRYVPAQWGPGTRWVEHAQRPTVPWFGFDAVPVVGDDVLLVPLRGHTRGHSGVAVRRPDDGWLLHCGDAYFSAGEKLDPPTCPSGLRAFQAFVQMDRKARHATQGRLRDLHRDHADEVTLFSAHDATEFDRLAAD